jgi:hypothetical protein
MSKTYLLHKPGEDPSVWQLVLDGRKASLRSGEKLLKSIDMVAEPRRIRVSESELLIDVAAYTADAATLAEIAQALRLAETYPAVASDSASSGAVDSSHGSHSARRRRRRWWKKYLTLYHLAWLVVVLVIVGVAIGAYRDVAQMVGWRTPERAEKPGEVDEQQMAVVGIVGPVALWEDPGLQERVKCQLSSGARVTVTPTSRARVVRAVTRRGDEGYLPRCALCSASEYERRRAQNEIPKQVYCIVAEGNRGAVLPLGVTGEATSVDRRRPLFAAGDGIWLDESMRGKEYYIGAEPVHGDPAIMFLMLPTGKLTRLEVW